MRKFLMGLFAAIISLCIFTSPIVALAGNGYTYTYDYWGDEQDSPDAYRILEVITYSELGLDRKLSNPQGIFIHKNMIYVCDTGNNRIIQIKRQGDEFLPVRVIDRFFGETDINTFSGPSDIYVSDNEDMYICDTENNRIVKLDKDLKLLSVLTKPEDVTFDQSLSYFPVKVVADESGRAFVLAKNVNKGIIKYENDGTFTGFIGANEVKYTWYEYVWRKLSTQEQKAKQASFVPTEYSNLCIDREGFLYTVTATFSTEELKTDQAKPIRKLNTTGKDILIKNGNYPPIGDLQWSTVVNFDGPSRMSDITAMDNEVYFALDRVRGRIFGYDSQGNLLFAFGGSGNMKGYFLTPSAIEHMGTDLLVLDSTDCSITVFTPTEYGSLLYKAIDEYMAGDYDASAAAWSKVLEYNGNYDQAYIGLGRALLRKGEYKQAMEYFKLTWNASNYSKAFKLYRKQWVEEHIGIIFLTAAVVLVIPLTLGRYKRIRQEVEKA